MPIKSKPVTEKKSNATSVSRALAKVRSVAKRKSSAEKATSTTRIVIRYDAGFGNNLSIRGEGAGLSWEQGQALKNENHDTWTWETTSSIENASFKVLLNDQEYESGENRCLNSKQEIIYSPHFPSRG